MPKEKIQCFTGSNKFQNSRKLKCNPECRCFTKRPFHFNFTNEVFLVKLRFIQHAIKTPFHYENLHTLIQEFYDRRVVVRNTKPAANVIFHRCYFRVELESTLCPHISWDRIFLDVLCLLSNENKKTKPTNRPNIVMENKLISTKIGAFITIEFYTFLIRIFLTVKNGIQNIFPPLEQHINFK